MAVDHSDAGDDAGRWGFIIVHAVRSERAEFKEWRVGIDYRVDAFTHEHLSAFLVTFDGSFTTAFFHDVEFRSKLGDQFPHFFRTWSRI